MINISKYWNKVLYLQFNLAQIQTLAMKRIGLFSLLIAGLVGVFTSCNHDLEDDTDSVFIGDVNVDNFQELVVPQNFNYNTTQEIDINVDVDFPDLPASTQYIVAVYQNNPQNVSGNKLVEGRLNQSNPFDLKIKVPTYLKTLWLELKIGAQPSTYKEVQLVNNSLNYSFSDSNKKGRRSYTRQPGPSCTTGCDQVISGNVSSITVPGNQTICLTGTLTGNINWQWPGGTLRVCGTVDAPNSQTNMWGDHHIEVVEGATFNYKYVELSNSATFKTYQNTTVRLKDLKINNTTNLFENYSTDLIFDKKFDPSGPFVNYGSIEVTDKVELNNNTVTYQNFGTIISDKKFENNATFINNGSVVVDDDFENNGTLNNNCSITSEDFDNNGPLTLTNAYISVDGRLQHNGGNNPLVLANQSMISTINLTVNASISGSGTAASAIKVAGNTTINGGGTISGSLDLCDPNGIENNYGSLGNGATTNCNVYIPVTSCNPEGLGSAPNPDTDNDGVVDIHDEYPNDPTKAFNNYYPNQNNFATTAFEDLWPSKGDYDFNDLVVAYQYQTVTNANNEVVQLIGRYNIKAVGAGFDNGFGVSLPIDNSVISSVTGTELITGSINLNANGTEAGHTGETVIMIYDNINSMLGGSLINVIPVTGTTMNIDTTVVTVNFNTPQANIGLAPFNPFIFINQDRGREVHLADQAPTDLVNPALFGTLDDGSNVTSSDYYVTPNQLPWAIDIPTEFDYLIEKNDILTGYNRFDDWAVSGGLTYTDWYLNTSGYRNSNNLY